jgi:hypothetical protein
MTRKAKITASFQKRDWRWLWLRKRPVEAVLFRGSVVDWDPDKSALEALRDAADKELP